MRAYCKNAVLSVILIVLVVAARGLETSANSTAGELFDYDSILAPGIVKPAPKAKPEPYRNPYMSYQPFTYVKGGVRYADFAGLPDFGQYARLGGLHTLVYPAYENCFYFVGSPGITYTYRSRIIDYIGAGDAAVKYYKAFIKSLGFIQKKTYDSEAFPEYAEIVDWNVRYDSDFTLDAEGVFIVEDLETFRWLLIGRSVAYDAEGALVDCVELRFYSLTRSDNYQLGALFETGKLGDTEMLSQTFLFTPDAALDIADIYAPRQAFFTPDALNDLTDAGEPPEDISPDAVLDLSDVKELLTGGL